MRWDKTQPAFGFLIHDVSRLLRKRFDRRARGLGLTKSQWIVLAHLGRHEGIKQSGLADILEVQPITLARHLDRLGDTGWIERRADPSDRRAWLLYLTPKAKPILEELGQLVDETMAEALAGLTDDEQARLYAGLIAVRGNLSEREGNGEASTVAAQAHGALEAAAANGAPPKSNGRARSRGRGAKATRTGPKRAKGIGAKAPAGKAGKRGEAPGAAKGGSNEGNPFLAAPDYD